MIIALSEKSRTHIPYRNSMMTSMLRDSLGGNCLTSMVATVSLEKKNIDVRYSAFCPESSLFFVLAEQIYFSIRITKRYCQGAENAHILAF